MELQIKILAVFHIIFGVLGVMGSLVVALLFGGAAGIVNMAVIDDPNAFLAVPVLGLVGGILVVSIFTLSLPSIIAGIGLLRHRPWARILTIVLSVLNLIVVPFGTLLLILSGNNPNGMAQMEKLNEPHHYVQVDPRPYLEDD